LSTAQTEDKILEWKGNGINKRGKKRCRYAVPFARNILRRLYFGNIV